MAGESSAQNTDKNYQIWNIFTKTVSFEKQILDLLSHILLSKTVGLDKGLGVRNENQEGRSSSQEKDQGLEFEE